MLSHSHLHTHVSVCLGLVCMHCSIAGLLVSLTIMPWRNFHVCFQLCSPRVHVSEELTWPGPRSEWRQSAVTALALCPAHLPIIFGGNCYPGQTLPLGWYFCIMVFNATWERWSCVAYSQLHRREHADTWIPDDFQKLTDRSWPSALFYFFL